MNEYLTYNEQELKFSKGFWTAKEIFQQPSSWKKTADIIEHIRPELDEWLQPILSKADLRIILCGAGSSAYIGESLVPHLSKETGRVFEAISTTNIVGNAENYLLPVPTLMISYGRSGNSPESVASVELADQVVNECYHLVITCNPDGELAQKSKQKNSYFSILMPEETLDQSFAMTSSFTSMLVSTLCIFTPDEKQLTRVIDCSQHIISEQSNDIKKTAKSPIERLVFLGAGNLLGIAKESALKCLELTSGQVVGYYESPLGFRHGPKSIVNSKTKIIIFKSFNDYTVQYDMDLIKELRNDQLAMDTIIIDNDYLELKDVDDVWAGLAYVVYSQILAFFMSMNLNITPDNPCPTGEVNRVVQGVTIYKL